MHAHDDAIASCMHVHACVLCMYGGWVQPVYIIIYNIACVLICMGDIYNIESAYIYWR